MKPILTREQVREIDRIAIEKYGLPGLLLMENAGNRATEILLAEYPNKILNVAIFCGRGNNGGDGYVIGRLLHERGHKVSIFLACSREAVKTSPDAETNLVRLEELGISPIETIPEDLFYFDLLIDGLLGTGATGAPRPPYDTIIQKINETKRPVIAIDLPSGLDANTGTIASCAIHATHTITFIGCKPGFLIAQGPKHVGQIHLADIGIPTEIIETFNVENGDVR